MKLVLPFPPSANTYWRMFRGHIVKSKKARDYQKSVAKMVLSQLGAKTPLPVFAGEVSVSLVAYRPAKRGDLDNFLKVSLDSLRGVVFADDDQVVRIVADRDDSHDRPRIELLIEPRHRPGQQNVFELNDAPALEPALPHVRPGFVDILVGGWTCMMHGRKNCAECPVPPPPARARVVESKPITTQRELAAKAKSGVISFRSK